MGEKGKKTGLLCTAKQLTTRFSYQHFVTPSLPTLEGGGGAEDSEKVIFMLEDKVKLLLEK